MRVTLQEIVLCCNTSVPSSNVVHNAKHICAGICSQWHSAPSSITHALVQHDLEAVSPIIVLAMIENKPVVDTNWIHAAADNDIASSDSSCLHHPSCSFRVTITPSVAKKPSELTAHAVLNDIAILCSRVGSSAHSPSQNPDEGDGNETGDDEDDHAERAEHKNEHEADQSGEQPLVALDRDIKLAFEKLGGYVVQTDSVDFNRHRWDDYSVALVDEKRVEDLERFKTPSAPNAPANHLTSVHRVFAAALLGDSSNLFVTQKPEQQQRSTVRKRAREPSAEGSEGEIEDREVNHLKKRCQEGALEQCDAAQETPEPSGNQEQQQHQQEDGGNDEGDNEDERDMQIVENEGEIGNAGVDIDEDGWVDISHRGLLPSKHPEGNAKAVEVDQEDIEEGDQRAESQVRCVLLHDELLGNRSEMCLPLESYRKRRRDRLVSRSSRSARGCRRRVRLLVIANLSWLLSMYAREQVNMTGEAMRQNERRCLMR